MNVELTIQHCFDKYPTLFKERADVLNHLFCTNGCGFEWEDGELVDADYTDTEIADLNMRLVDGKAHQYNKMSLRAESIHYGLQRKIKQGFVVPEDPMDVFDDFEKEYYNSLPDDKYYEKPRYKRWYFFVDIPGREYIDMHEKYVHLFNYPENIKPDWLEAINECRKLLIEDGFVLPK